MDAYEQAYDERRRLLRAACDRCGQGRGFRCVDAGGRVLPITRQHVSRYRNAGIEPGLLRALLVKANLV